MIEHVDRGMMRRGVVVAAAFAVLFGCTSTPSGQVESDSSPLADAIGYDPMNNIFPVRRFAEIEAECIRGWGFSVDVDLPSPTTVPEESFLGSIFSMVPGDTSEQPYREFRASLSDAEEARFREALVECNGSTSKEVYGSADGYPEPFTAALDEMYARVQADPRRLKVSKAYSDCMSDRGFGDDYETPNAVGDELFAMEEELIDMLNENNDLKPSDPRVAEMLEFERSILNASAECLERSDFDAVVAEVALDVQVEYLEQHPDLAPQVFGESSAPTPDS